MTTIAAQHNKLFNVKLGKFLDTNNSPCSSLLVEWLLPQTWLQRSHNHTISNQLVSCLLTWLCNMHHQSYTRLVPCRERRKEVNNAHNHN